MARGKKKEKELTPEEKLQQALVPAEEQPYKVPENWCWVKVETCCDDLFHGKSPKYSKLPTDYPIIGQQVVQRYGIDLKYIKYGTNEFGSSQENRLFLKYNDVLLNTLGTGTIGRSGIYKQEKRILTDGHPFVFRLNERYSPDLFHYYLQYREEDIVNTANGSTNQKFLSLQSFSKYPIPLVPRAEQKRIVDRIESLFAKLDEAKEKAQAVVDGFEDRKAAILHKAFTGELTERWRIQNGIDKEEWDSVILDSIANAIDPQPSHRTPAVSDDGIPYVGIAECNYESGEIDFSSARKVSHTVLREHINRYRLSKGDFIIGKIGTVGKPFKIPSEQFYTLSANVVLIQPFLDNVNADYLYHYFQSDFVENQFKEGSKATTQAAFGIKKVRYISILLPSMPEQEEIVLILERSLLQGRQAKEAAEQVIDQIDIMKKSILARAFRGELGTNDSADESAEELLKRIV